MFAYRAERRGDQTLDHLTDEDAGFRIVVSRLGAELVSLARRRPTGDWTGFLYRDDDLTSPNSGWANHATVMGYFLHRLKDGRSLYRGHEIKGGNHSFLRTRHWHFAGDGADRGELSYQITPADFSATEYPLPVGLNLTYRIAGDRLEVVFHFHNADPTLDAHLEFGLHPGFAAATFESFSLKVPPGVYRRHFSPGNYLSGETQDIEFAGGEMPFPREQLPGSYILEFVSVPDRKFRYFDRESRREVTLDLTGVPYLTLWSDGGPFLCIEPCWGLTDHDRQRPFEQKEGIQVVPAGGELVAQFALSPRLLD